ncbi:hypothetical protein INR49_028006 [Caranx melampygus]|nr:hypothetical protein INR49_028006 [Caranx melampygus]
MGSLKCLDPYLSSWSVALEQEAGGVVTHGKRVAGCCDQSTVTEAIRHPDNRTDPILSQFCHYFLGGFGHAHQRWPEGATVKLVAHFGYHGDSARLLALHRGVEESLVLVGVELLAVGVELDQAVLGEHLLDLDLGHHQAVVQVLQMRVLARHLLLGHALCSLLQDVGHFQQVFTEALDPWHSELKFYLAPSKTQSQRWNVVMLAGSGPDQTIVVCNFAPVLEKYVTCEN